MGNNENEYLGGLLVQKDQEIAALETQVQAYIARTSVLQSRLLSTLDTLDVIQSGQNNELDAMAQTNRRLKDRLDQYSVIVKTAELEKDDMRDAVLKLIKKVELSNGYSMWPHSRICLSSLAGSPVIPPSPVVQPSESDSLLHATSMIETLRRERDLERKAHARTRDLAQARIVSLAAQLSRREAELESFISGTAHTASTVQLKHPRQAELLIDEPFTTEQVISALCARNKALEVEIRGLFKRLEDVRLAASSSNLDGSPPPPSSGFQQRRDKQWPLESITSAIPPQNTTLQKVQSTSVLEGFGEPPLYEYSQPTGPDQALDLSDPEYRDLERQIKTLGAKIDAFAETRKSMSQTLRTNLHKEDTCCSIETRLESLEIKNNRLRLSERNLRDELEATHISTQARESELLDEIQLLQSRQQMANSICNLLEPDNGEMSMELATPLLPTSMIPDVNDPHAGSLSPDLDPPFIPLPPSPSNHHTSSSPALSEIILSDRNTHRQSPDLPVNEMGHLTRAPRPP